MKWVKQKRSSVWDAFDSYKAKTKNCTITVREASNGYGREIEFYYFSVNSEKHSITFNSLWQDMKYDNLTEATEHAEKWLEIYLDPAKGGQRE